MSLTRSLFRLGWIVCVQPMVAVLTVTAARPQTTIHVPSDVATIQGAIDAAGPGDTVLIAPGVYHERIDFQGKAITVEGAAAANTVLDGGSGAGAVVRFASGEGRDSVLSRITVENGAPAVIPDAGGIFVYKSSPTISDAIVKNNTGCGIGAFNSAPLIEGNLIEGTNPGAVACTPSAKDDPGSPTAPAPATADPARGTAILLDGLPMNGQAEVVGNRIQGNMAHESAAGIYLADAAVPLVENNVICGNHSDFSAALWSAGNTAPTIVQNLIYGNTSDSTPIVNPLGFEFSAVTVDNFQGQYPTLSVVANNTIADNQTIVAPGVLSNGPDTATPFGSQLLVTGDTSLFLVVNNILVGAGPISTLGCAPNPQSAPPPTVRTNDVTALVGTAPFGGNCAGADGVDGNLSLDPLFVSAGPSDPNPFQLSLPSPAVDAGLNTAPDLPAEDLLGNPRIQNAKGLPSAIIDMGVYEYKGIAAPAVSPDFSLKIDPTSLVLHGAQTGTVAVTVTPNTSFAGGVFLSCAGLPATLTCSFAPSIVNLEAGSPGTATLTVSEGSSTALFSSGFPGSGDRKMLMIPGLLSLGFLLRWCRARNRRGYMITLLGLAVLPSVISGCGATIVPGQQTERTIIVTGSSGVGQLVRTAGLQVTQE